MTEPRSSVLLKIEDAVNEDHIRSLLHFTEYELTTVDGYQDCEVIYFVITVPFKMAAVVYAVMKGEGFYVIGGGR